MPVVYYNEIDPYAVEWLKNLIAAGFLPDGYVDSRPIQEVEPYDIKGFNQCHFFAGIGGWAFATQLAGVGPDVPLWTGSCPCQPFSAAGKQEGTSDARHLWPEWFRLIRQCRPSVVLGEQVERAVKLGWYDEVATSLETEGYAVGATVLPASSVNAWHQRNRLWFVAHAIRDKQSWEKPRGRQVGRVGRLQQPVSWDIPWKAALSLFRALDDGVPRRVAATDAARNAIVPQVAQVFIEEALNTIEQQYA